MQSHLTSYFRRTLSLFMGAALLVLGLVFTVPAAAGEHARHGHHNHHALTAFEKHDASGGTNFCPTSHHPMKEMCPWHYAGAMTIGTDCGGNPAGIAAGPGFSHDPAETGVNIASCSQPEARKLLAFASTYKSFVSNPLDHPPSSL